ncbi:hypothetical protein P6F26_03355 [Roseibacterium sp. SDUM158017]|uniref:hypothetical protein n=1 Tax=Roseicyclus salinarum TaxID=3036773 RepID=UPI00241552DC|nr:hypothetical protein [Roseibacterium sp. SDUM158017]MDG4647470.1 hypothetical protein [Roseibacterium sp. SDUM158017]
MPGLLIRLREKFPDAFVLIVVVAVLTGCATAPPRPVEVSLDRSTLEVRLSNGETCTGPVAVVPASNGRTTVSGEGRLGGCAAALDYRVEGETGTNPLRVVMEEVFTALGLPDAVAPDARVEITAPDGRAWTFASPPARARD